MSEAPRLWVKICGLRTMQDVTVAVDAGADAVGFVFAPGSPRTVTADEARTLIAGVPGGVRTVGVFRGQPIDEVLAIADAAGVDTVQLHGDEPASAFADARERGYAVIRAVSAERWLHETPAQRAAFGDTPLLLDAPEPGSGTRSDADVSGDAAPAGWWALAGGLDPSNVARLARRLRPSGVDVSSGVESARGVKDHDRIRAFVAAARGGSTRDTAAGPS